MRDASVPQDFEDGLENPSLGGSVGRRRVPATDNFQKGQWYMTQDGFERMSRAYLKRARPTLSPNQDVSMNAADRCPRPLTASTIPVRAVAPSGVRGSTGIRTVRAGTTLQALIFGPGIISLQPMIWSAPAVFLGATLK